MPSNWKDTLRINDQWRICFQWEGTDAHAVEIVLERRGITADTALRLARFFGTSAEIWTGLQADYDLRLARYQKERQIEREVEPLADMQPAVT